MATTLAQRKGTFMSVVSGSSSLKTNGAGANPCPKCGKPLTDAAGLGWCPACGYCRSLEEAQVSLPARREAPAQQPSMGGLVELGQAVGGLPNWVWIMLMGVAGFGAFSLLPAYQLPKDSFDR